MRSVTVLLVMLLAALFSLPLSSLASQFLGRRVEHNATISKYINVDLFIIQNPAKLQLIVRDHHRHLCHQFLWASRSVLSEPP
jgi:hypothetical protein